MEGFGRFEGRGLEMAKFEVLGVRGLISLI